MKPPSERLNPFAFPSETNVRFTLLVIAALVLAFNLGFILADRLGLPSPAILGEIVAAASAMPPVGTADSPGGAQQYQRYLDENIALLGKLLAIIALPLALVILVLVVATSLYRLHPYWIRRGKQLRPLDAARDYEMVRELDELVAATGSGKRVQAELADKSEKTDNRIFGFPKRYALILRNNERVRVVKAPQQFRAIVLHELAHIANRDIGRTYFSQALWIALVAMAIVPVVAIVSLRFGADTITRLWNAGSNGLDWGFLFTDSLPRLGFVELQMAVTWAVVLAVRASLLRARELYADWRVALWGAGSALDELITGDKRDAKGWAFWSYHPVKQARLDTLRRPIRLFRLAPSLAFFVGFFCILVWISIIVALGVLGVVIFTLPAIWIAAALADPAVTSPLISSASLALPLLLFIVAVAVASVCFGAGYLLTGTLGLEVQRAAMADLVEQRSVGRSWIALAGPAALVSLGIQCGIVFTPYSLFAGTGAQSLLLLVIGIVAWTLPMWLWLVYAYGLARAVLGRYSGSEPPLFRRRLLALILFVCAGIALAPPVIGQLIAVTSATQSGSSVVVSTFQTLVLPLVLELGLFGALAVASWIVLHVWRRVRPIRCPACDQVASQPYAVSQQCVHCQAELAPWLFIEPTQSELQPPTQQRMSWRQRTVLLLGVAGACVLLAIFVAVPWIYTMMRSSSVPGNEPIHTYTVNGRNLNGDTYTGSLVITQIGDQYQLKWATNAGDYTGRGIRDDDTLTVTYGDLSFCGVIAYHVQADGSLDGRQIAPGIQALAQEKATRNGTPSTHDVAGSYQVAVPGVPSSTYIGTLTITSSDATYQLAWQTNVINFTGTGVRQGDTLAVVYAISEAYKQCGLVVYHVLSDGSLDGRWTVQGESQVGTEQAQPTK